MATPETKAIEQQWDDWFLSDPVMAKIRAEIQAGNRPGGALWRPTGNWWESKRGKELRDQVDARMREVVKSGDLPELPENYREDLDLEGVDHQNFVERNADKIAITAAIVIATWGVGTVLASGPAATTAGLPATTATTATTAATTATTATTAAMSIMDWVSLGTQIGGTIWDAISQFQAGEAAKEIAELNAKAAEDQAADALERGREDEQSLRQGVRTLIGSQRASFAGQNVDVAVGSPVDVQADAAYLGELDARTIRKNAQREADARTKEAEILRKGGDLRAREARFAAASTIISGANNLLSNRYGWGG
jgi:hypothetical protein